MDLMKQLTDTTSHFFRSLESEHAGLLQGLKRRGGYTALNRLVGMAVPFATRNRFQVVALRPGYIKASVALKGNKNHIGTMYAGAMFVLAEIPGGVLSFLEFGTDYVPILRELSMSYLQTASSDITVEFQLPPEEIQRIREEADRQGKTNFTLQGELRDAQGDLIARSIAQYQVRKSGWHCGG